MRSATAGRLLVLSLIWGASFLFIKVGVEGMHPTLVALGRIAVGAVVVTVWLRFSRLAFPRGWAEWARLGFMAVFANMIPFTLIAVGERHISSALASVLNATTPLMTAVAAVVVIRVESMSWPRALGIAVGFAGVAVVVLPGAGLAGSRIIGSAAVLASTAGYGIAGAFAKRYMRSEPLSGAAGQLLLATGGMAAVATVVARWAPFELTAARALAVATLGALGTGFAWVLYLRIIAEEGPTTASLATYMVPFVAVVIGRLVLHEALRWNAYAGGAIVIAGIALAEGRLAREPATPVATAEVASEPR